MRWPWSKPQPFTAEQEAEFARARVAARRSEALAAASIEACERAALDCLDCEIGEPHVCERAWWEQRYQHLRGAECVDPDCLCHPVQCDCCGQTISREVLIGRARRAGMDVIA